MKRKVLLYLSIGFGAILLFFALLNIAEHLVDATYKHNDNKQLKVIQEKLDSLETKKKEYEKSYDSIKSVLVLPEY